MTYGKKYTEMEIVFHFSPQFVENIFYKIYLVSYNIHAEALVGLHAQRKFLLPDSDQGSNVSTHCSKTL